MASPLLITLSHRARSINVEIRVDGPAQVGDLADALVQQLQLIQTPRIPSLTVRRTGETLARGARLPDADLRSGDEVQLRDASLAVEKAGLSAAAVAEVIEGADTGRLFELRPGRLPRELPDNASTPAVVGRFFSLLWAVLGRTAFGRLLPKPTASPAHHS